MDSLMYQLIFLANSCESAENLSFSLKAAVIFNHKSRRY